MNSPRQFQTIKNAPGAPRQFTQRDLDILVDQVQIMTRQNGDLAAALAGAEAVNHRLAQEHQQMQVELDALKAAKGKKG